MTSGYGCTQFLGPYLVMVVSNLIVKKAVVALAMEKIGKLNNYSESDVSFFQNELKQNLYKLHYILLPVITTSMGSTFLLKSFDLTITVHNIL